MTGNKCSQESLNIENKQSIPSVHTNKQQTKDKLNKQPLIEHSKIAHSVNEKDSHKTLHTAYLIHSPPLPTSKF